MFGDSLGSGCRNDTVFCQNRACGRLHLQPAAVLVVFGPDASHCRACVAINHWQTPGTRANSRRGRIPGPSPTPDCTRLSCSGPGNAEAFMQLVVEKAAPRLVGLEPFAIYYKLWNCPLAHMADDLRGCGGICVHIYFG